jgi:hypothetical protein
MRTEVVLRYEPRDMDGLYAGQFSPEDYGPYLKSGEMHIEYRGIAGQLLGLGTLVWDRKEEN